MHIGANKPLLDGSRGPPRLFSYGAHHFPPTPKDRRPLDDLGNLDSLMGLSLVRFLLDHLL
jgi:hypothetical protein